MKFQIRRDIDRIVQQFDEFEALSEAAAERVERVSKWSVGQHLDHLMKADRTIFERFPQPEEGPLRPVTSVGRIVLWSGWIPRGKGKAPSATEPAAPPPETLLAELETIRKLFDTSVSSGEALLEPQAIAKHPYFGGLNRAQWLRFVGVHHHHHAKIIRDVLRAHP